MGLLDPTKFTAAQLKELAETGQPVIHKPLESAIPTIRYTDDIQFAIDRLKQIATTGLLEHQVAACEAIVRCLVMIGPPRILSKSLAKHEEADE